MVRVIYIHISTWFSSSCPNLCSRWNDLSSTHSHGFITSWKKRPTSLIPPHKQTPNRQRYCQDSAWSPLFSTNLLLNFTTANHLTSDSLPRLSSVITTTLQEEREKICEEIDLLSRRVIVALRLKSVDHLEFAANLTRIFEKSRQLPTNQQRNNCSKILIVASKGHLKSIQRQDRSDLIDRYSEEVYHATTDFLETLSQYRSGPMPSLRDSTQPKSPLERQNSNLAPPTTPLPPLPRSKQGQEPVRKVSCQWLCFLIQTRLGEKVRDHIKTK